MVRKFPNTIVLSFPPDCNDQVKSKTIDRAVVGLVAFGESLVFRLNFSSDTLILTTCTRDLISVQKKFGIVSHMRHVLSRNGEAVPVSGLLKHFRDGGTNCFDAFEPPFLLFAGSANKVVATSDRIGLAHLFSWQSEKYAVIATSATLIAKVFNCKFNAEGVFQHMTVGHRLNKATAFNGVELVPPGAKVFAQNGRLSFDLPEKHPSVATPHPINDGCSVVANAVERCLSADPDCGIELSGGLDSRMVLAAIPKNLRQGRTAYTIGYEGTQDVEIARDIARKCCLDHVFVDLAKFKDESSDITWRRAHRIAHRDDFSTNILDRLAIDCVDDVLLDRARIGGVNGELARGFYYTNMPINASVSEDAIDRLIAWRLTTNDAAPRELFDPTVLQTYTASLRSIIARILKAGPQPLGNSLDQFYLDQRMRHWAGSAITRAISNRMVFTPFFHSDYIDWATNLPVNLKKDSMAFSSVLTQLDPCLAGMALDSMLVPSQLANGGAMARFALLRSKAMKLKTKIMQRLIGTRQSSLGTNQFQIKLCQPEIVEQIDWTKLETIGLFDPRGLKKLRKREIPWNRVTLGYIFTLHFQLEYLSRACQNEEYKIVDL